MAARHRSGRHRSAADPAAKRVGARVRRLRLETGYSFDAFVEETGLGRGYVSELERGLVVPSLTTLERLAAALEVTAADLVLGSTERERLFDRARGLAARDVERMLRLADDLSPARRDAAGPPPAPLRQVTEAVAKRHRSAVPLLSVRAAAGAWSSAQRADVEAWVVVPLRVPSKKGLFVARVAGRSMEPAVPDGAYCLFQRPWAGPAPGEVGLFVRWDDEGEGEPGRGRFALKEYRPELRETEAGDVVAGTLRARNPAHRSLSPSNLDHAPERAWARLLRVLP